MRLAQIPIGRFKAETPLARDTYLFLPLNNKTIRIGLAGDTIPEPMLSRILSKGHTHLCIGEESNVNPDTFPVHLDAGEASQALFAPSPKPVTVADSAPETAVAADAFALAEESTFAKETASEPSQSFTADPVTEDVARIGGGVADEETVTKLGEREEEEEIETRFNHDEEEEVVRAVSGSREEKERYIRKFAAERDSLPALIRLRQKLSEANGEDPAIDLSAEKESALKEARTVILSSKISEKIISLSEQARTAEPKLRESLREQVRSLKSSLDQVDSGDLSLEEKAEFETKEEIASVVESLASASHAKQVEEITERLSTHALTRALAFAAMEEQDQAPIARAMVDRGLPATVSRLAAYLGHSLGYTNVDFLADLACGAIAYFAKKEGGSLNEDLLPPFTKRIISSDDALPDETIADSREILRFLDAYIDDAECDRTHKDLIKRVFDRTTQELSERDDGPSPWTLKKWSSFVDRGPTMDAHSICTRASAKAIKFARGASR